MQIKIRIKSSLVKNNEQLVPKKRPSLSRNIFTDIKYFFIDKPPVQTLIHFETEQERQIYSESILQRLGTGVENYRMLNIHRIGVEVPVSYVFDELLKWNGDSFCWPNHIAKVNLLDNRLEKIQIFLFGRTKYMFGLKNGIFGLKLFHLFDLNAIRIQKVPAPDDSDNARYLLYQCKGGYPIGIFSMYVRSSIPERGETEMSQLFIMVGFNFYGKSLLSKIRLVRKVWELIHNRVTTNVVYRIKQLSEWRFDKFVSGNSYTKNE